ncbi:hypothetical protein CAPTEDRAFT_227663 [Capitella teleta]|uniref:Uncharacterized protein n=1 Tax=Capitella teleta TaxID=283909 RepID=R7UY19_CAPTE|nr:hypothetical protein CAPTEDRAFT_227663 [Capitella teleta]|eukprot:ELU08331.1 hypothetical protein CAPTEDRAFT_227663 [Capitella teleta]
MDVDIDTVHCEFLLMLIREGKPNQHSCKSKLERFRPKAFYRSASGHHKKKPIRFIAESSSIRDSIHMLTTGQLDVLLKRVESGELRLSQATEDRIRVIQQTSNRLADIGAEAVEKSQPVYFEQIGGLLRPSFWTLDRSSRSVDLSLHSRPVVDGEAIHESDSDKCLWELLGTDPRHSGEKCRVSQKCWAMMTAPGYKMYSLTHEVFYLQIAEQLGCLRHELPVTLRLTDEFCSNAYVESAQIATDGFPEQHKDLFMEQAALCGMSGYRDFFNREWLDSILAWQRTGAGCWGLPLDGPDDTSDLKRRVKREERVLTDGCEFHRTAVALGALSQYTRYVIEYSQKYLF